MKKILDNWINSDIYRSKIHNLIPGGAHTYSKGDDQFPLEAPAAIARGKGAWVWDIDENKFLDCSMGLTSVSLGHAFQPVVEAVSKELENGVNFQRPSHLELKIAEEFLSLVPQHQMIKFTKNGSTATTAAVKLARAYTGKSKVAFPSDHPFYSYDDWFIGRTECPRGVPTLLKDLSCTYQSQNLESLAKLFAQFPNEIACVISEPERLTPQAPDYIHKIIDLCHKNGAVFIQDEMITGFKTDFPGSIRKLGVEPDIATWGKGIANGFSFCALTGKKEIMELGGIKEIGREKVFLASTTHGGETHAIAAALATIKCFKEMDVIGHNHDIGRRFIKGVREILTAQGLSSLIHLSDTEWMIGFTFLNSKQEVDNGYQTLMLQEMIQRGVLFQGTFVPCFSHNTDELNFFFNAFEQSSRVYKMALETGYESVLRGPPTKPVFRKYL